MADVTKPPRPQVLTTGRYAGRWLSCVPTRELEALLAKRDDVPDAELSAITEELKFRVFLRSKGLHREPTG